MNIRDAILASASYIETYPFEFDWMSCVVPKAKHCGTPGCAIGWIGMFLGAPATAMGFFNVKAALRVSDARVFYTRMGALSSKRFGSTEKWKHEADACAITLRAYADIYHAPAKRTDAELVADLMEKVTSDERIPEDA